MRRSRLIAMVLIVAAATGTLAVGPTPDVARLQGTWQIVSVERSGANDPSAVGNTLTILGNEARFSTPLDSPGMTIVSIQEIDPKQIQKLAFS